jgi:hypothetical protein
MKPMTAEWIAKAEGDFAVMERECLVVRNACSDRCRCERLGSFAAGVPKKNVPHVIAKERSDCGNLNPCAKRRVYFLRSEAKQF